jgi:hypothetical protein
VEPTDVAFKKLVTVLDLHVLWQMHWGGPVGWAALRTKY